MRRVAKYLNTLRRIPDDIVLSMASRDVNPNNGNTCICGWAIRESVARALNCDAEATSVLDILAIDRNLANAFGGTKDEWASLYFDAGMYGYPAAVEEAFTRRVMEAAGVAA